MAKSIYSVEQRIDLLNKHRKSKEGVLEFCRNNEIQYSTFKNWARRENSQTTKNLTNGKKGAIGQISGDFLKIKVVQSKQTQQISAKTLKLKSANGSCLEIPTSLDANWIAALLKEFL